MKFKLALVCAVSIFSQHLLAMTFSEQLCGHQRAVKMAQPVSEKAKKLIEFLRWIVVQKPGPGGAVAKAEIYATGGTTYWQKCFFVPTGEQFQEIINAGFNDGSVLSTLKTCVDAVVAAFDTYEVLSVPSSSPRTTHHHLDPCDGNSDFIVVSTDSFVQETKKAHITEKDEAAYDQALAWASKIYALAGWAPVTPKSSVRSTSFPGFSGEPEDIVKQLKPLLDGLLSALHAKILLLRASSADTSNLEAELAMLRAKASTAATMADAITRIMTLLGPNLTVGRI